MVMKNKTGISIVIPARNEAKRLPLFLDKLLSYCRDDKNRYEIIVVDDASNDNTCDIAASYKCHFPIFHIIKIKKKKGKGYAVKIGLLRSSKAVCVFTDADGSFDPDEI
jgi:dolichyl-phosphate beta-glucosyltransferase